MRDALRFAVEFVFAMCALSAGLFALWVIGKVGPPVLAFFVGIGL